MAKAESSHDAGMRRAVKLGVAARLLAVLVLIAFSVVFLLPFWTMVMMSLKDPTELARTSPVSWPQALTWENYQEVLTNPLAPFGRFFWNSTVISTLATVGVIISSSMVAYPFARLNFRGKNRLFMLLLSTMMLPGVVTMIPNYIVFTWLNWIDTFNPLIIPAYFGGGAFNIFLVRQFFMTIPRELDEAAYLDGAGHWTIFWNVIMPNSIPVLATITIFSFIYNWRDFMGPLMILNSIENQTLELGLRTYQTLQQEQWHLLMAAAVLVILPLIFLFIVGQRFFIKGVVMTGMK
jgi:ABC-type glycerol-3-phosphate transport system permease component